MGGGGCMREEVVGVVGGGCCKGVLWGCVRLCLLTR